MLEIDIEIGTEEQNEQIKAELSIFSSIYKKSEFIPRINRIIIPADFKTTIQRLTSDPSFNIQRGSSESSIHVTAKIINVDDEKILVLSPYIYTEGWDMHLRYLIYLHEQAHLNCDIMKADYSDMSRSKRDYMDILYELYHEYYCDRFAYEIINNVFGDLSDLYIQRIEENFENYNRIFNDKSYENIISTQTKLFNEKQIDRDTFIKEWNVVFGVIPYAIAHYYALVHEYDNLAERAIFNLPPFINSCTMDLIKYFDDKYNNYDFDLTDGIERIDFFMRNLGVQYIDDGGENIFIKFVELYDYY